MEKVGNKEGAGEGTGLQHGRTAQSDEEHRTRQPRRFYKQK